MDNPLNKATGASLVSPPELQQALASLSRGVYTREASLEMMLVILTESVGQMCGIGRVSIWALSDDRQELRCLDMYDCTTERHGKGQCIQAAQYPAYFEALGEGAVISADDALHHPLTTGFGVDCLLHQRATAFLDTPIHVRGELQGMLCMEQVSTRQPWGSAYHLFAQAVANLITLALVQYEACEAHLEAHAAGERLRTVYDAVREALSDASDWRQVPNLTL